MSPYVSDYVIVYKSIRPLFFLYIYKWVKGEIIKQTIKQTIKKKQKKQKGKILIKNKIKNSILTHGKEKPGLIMRKVGENDTRAWLQLIK